MAVILVMNATRLNNTIMPIVRWYDEHEDNNFVNNVHFCAHQIEEYLEDHPADTEWWLRLANLYFETPIEDYEMIIDSLEEIFTYDPYNLQATLMYAFAEDYFIAGVREKTFARLKSVKPISCCDKSMVFLAMSWRYSSRRKHEAQMFLRSAAASCGHCIAPWIKIIHSSKNLLEKMVCSNYVIGFIKKNPHLINKKYTESMINVDQFFDEWYRGYFTRSWSQAALREYMYGVLDRQSSALHNKYIR